MFLCKKRTAPAKNIIWVLIAVIAIIDFINFRINNNDFIAKTYQAQRPV